MTACVYSYCEANKIQHRFNVKQKVAGKSNCNSESTCGPKRVRRGLMVIQSTTHRASTAKSPLISRQCSGGNVIAVRCGLVMTVGIWAKKRLSSSGVSRRGNISACPPVRVEKFQFCYLCCILSYLRCHFWLLSLASGSEDTHRGSAPRPRWGTSVPQTPWMSPSTKSWLRHCCLRLWPLHASLAVYSFNLLGLTVIISLHYQSAYLGFALCNFVVRPTVLSF